MTKNSDCVAGMSGETLAGVRQPRGLLGISHYQQAPGTQPRAMRLPRGCEHVEVVTGGRGWVEAEDGWTEVRVGDFLWHVQGEKTIGRSDESDPYSCLAVRFLVSKVSARRVVSRFQHWPDLEKLRLLTEELVGLYVGGVFPREVLAYYAHAVLLREAIAQSARSHEESLPEPLRRVLALVDRQFARPLRVGELAAHAGWSAAHLHEQSVERLGITPHGLVTARRLRAARTLLATTNHPLKVIAAECGFPHASALCRHFRQSSGQTPAEYRNRARGQQSEARARLRD